MATNTTSAVTAMPIRRVRLSLSGTFGVGKTTMLTPLARRLDLPIVDEAARDLLQAGRDVTSAEVQAATILLQIARERSLHSFIADRSLIDSLAYSRLGCAGSAPGSLEREVFEGCIGYCEAALRDRYTHVVLVGLSARVPSVPPGYEIWQRQVHVEVLATVRSSGLPWVEVAGSPTERVASAASWVDSFQVEDGPG